MSEKNKNKTKNESISSTSNIDTTQSPKNLLELDSAIFEIDQQLRSISKNTPTSIAIYGLIIAWVLFIVMITLEINFLVNLAIAVPIVIVGFISEQRRANFREINENRLEINRLRQEKFTLMNEYKVRWSESLMEQYSTLKNQLKNQSKSFHKIELDFYLTKENLFIFISDTTVRTEIGNRNFKPSEIDQDAFIASKIIEIPRDSILKVELLTFAEKEFVIGPGTRFIGTPYNKADSEIRIVALKYFDNEELLTLYMRYEVYADFEMYLTEKVHTELGFSPKSSKELTESSNKKDSLIKLKQMFDEDLITREEFENLRKKELGL